MPYLLYDAQNGLNPRLFRAFLPFFAELKSLQIQVELLYLLVKQAVQLVAKNMKLQGKCG